MSNFVVFISWFWDFIYPTVLILWYCKDLILFLIAGYALVRTFQLENELAKLSKDNQNKEVKFKFYRLLEGGQKKEITMAEKISVGGKVKIVVEPLDKFENKAELDGSVAVLSNSDETLGVASVVAPLEVDVMNPGKMGLQKIDIEGDALIGEGKVPVIGSVEIEWVPGIATHFKTVVVKMEEVPAPAPEPVPEEQPQTLKK